VLFHDFIYNPDSTLLPEYRISPFKTQDIAFNHSLPSSDAIDSYFGKRFPARQFIYTKSGRSAISIALSELRLQKDDIITILTTSGNSYISGCVTREIEKYCQWSRKLENNSRAIFVNHEFGFCFEKLETLKQYRLPIIEDCAHSFVSDNLERTTAQVGDFTIFSFPKFFPIQCGGGLLCKREVEIKSDIEMNMADYIKRVLSYYVDQIEEFSLRRLKNYRYLTGLLNSIDLPVRFEITPGSIPGVFVFKDKNRIMNLPALKTFLWNQGIECSVFYGEPAFYLPVHDRLVRGDLEFFFEAIRFFLFSEMEKRN
jgi:hypothetical protein